MTGRRKALAVGCLGALVVAAALVVWVLARAGPYGEDRLPEWIAQARPVVEAVRKFRADKGRWPESLDALVPAYLPARPEPAAFTGCRSIGYSVAEAGGAAGCLQVIGPVPALEAPPPDRREKLLRDGVFKLHLGIHMREAVEYSSDGDTSLNWGTQRVLDGWVYTRD